MRSNLLFHQKTGSMRHFFIGLITVLCCLSFSADAQSSTDSLPPYRKYKQLPAFQVVMPDSSRVFNSYNIRKGKPSVLIMFSPDCSHCEQLAGMLLDSIRAFRDVNIIMASPFPLAEIRSYIAKTKIDQAAQIVIGKDASYFFWSFYKADTVPFIAVYDKNKTFVSTVTHLKSIDELLEVLKPLQ